MSDALKITELDQIVASPISRNKATNIFRQTRHLNDLQQLSVSLRSNHGTTLKLLLQNWSRTGIGFEVD